MNKYFKTPRKSTKKIIKYIWETLLMIASFCGISIASYCKPETYEKSKEVDYTEIVEECLKEQKLNEEIEKQASL